MTVLERLAATKSGLVADLVERRKASIQTETAAPPTEPLAWKNKPSWDNWKKKTPKWKKKRVYFKNR